MEHAFDSARKGFRRVPAAVPRPPGERGGRGTACPQDRKPKNPDLCHPAGPPPARAGPRWEAANGKEDP
ncbi:hypothetical protein Pve01_71840 [Planomonospora venezuelensis]|nr:hypothetical protein Pve01_71840 [Planomonospora venezuelensis]